ncbi:hypothetical protein C8R45DRAFT_949906 [Mycena sanguinolenta]|nr:hypothetical protein C8R45DRAFT_949906 [Mycena sanguinolenta]
MSMSIVARKTEALLCVPCAGLCALQWMMDVLRGHHVRGEGVELLCMQLVSSMLIQLSTRLYWQESTYTHGKN